MTSDLRADVLALADELERREAKADAVAARADSHVRSFQTGRAEALRDAAERLRRLVARRDEALGVPPDAAREAT